MKKRSKERMKAMKRRKKRHADSTSHEAPKPMQAAMPSRSSGRSTIASPAASSR